MIWSWERELLDKISHCSKYIEEQNEKVTVRILQKLYEWR